MRSRVLFLPSVTSVAELAPLVSHIGHYLSHIDCERITVPIDRRILVEAKAWMEDPQVPTSFDPVVAERVRRVAESLDLRPWPSTLVPPILSSDLIAVWDTARAERKPWAMLRERFIRNVTEYTVDWNRTRLGASWFAEMAKVLEEGRQFAGFGVEKFADFVDRHQAVDKAYLIGTGPSARSALDYDVTDGVRIACNTIVLDRELMEHLNPHVLTFADPIFHFGPSTYAQQFQRAVVERARDHEFLIVTTERFAPLLAAHAPELEGRIVGLRQGSSTWPDNLGLRRHPAVRPYPNILTMLMLPVAAATARDVQLVGFDGRTPEDDHFWKHGSTVQFDREMTDIRNVHPGFFKVDYEDYYSTHLEQLEWVIRRMELRGITVSSISQSHMPPLQRRRQVESDADPAVDPTKPLLVSVTPDWINEFGHFGPFERRLHEAAERLGYQHMSLGSAGLSPVEAWQVPVFTGFGATVTRGGEPFPSQLAVALRNLNPIAGSVVAMYAGDVWHVPAFMEVSREFPHVTFVVNLMKAHAWIKAAGMNDNPWSANLLALLRTCLDVASGTNVHVTADTDQLQADLRGLGCESAKVWPMAAVWPVSDSESQERTTIDGPVRIVSPVHAHINKGIQDVAALSTRLRARLSEGGVTLTVRSAPQPTPVSPEIREACEVLEANGAHMERRNLTDAEYVDLVAAADIVLVPYRLEPFRTRTSGVILDALLAGKPVLATRGTWAGTLVDKYGAGATYQESDIDEMEEALARIVTDIDIYRSRLAELRPSIVHDFSPDRTVEFLSSLSAGKSPPAASVHVITQRTTELRSLFVDRTKQTENAKVDLAVLRDTRNRIERIRDDEIAVLRGSLEWHRHQIQRPPTAKRELSQHDYTREQHVRIDEVKLVAAIVDPKASRSGLMVDVGAHRGSSLAHFVKRNWEVMAFEPDSRHSAYLRSVYDDDERVVVDERAVTERSGQSLPFYISEESTGVSALSAFLDSHVQQSVVETVSLADVVHGRHVGVLKVDTEGYELKVLDGYPWDSDSPDVIVCEYEDQKTRQLGYETRDLCEFLSQRGYQVWVSEWHPIVRYGIAHDWRRLFEYRGEPPATEGWGNLIAFRRPVSSAALAAALEDQIGEQLPAHAEPTDRGTGAAKTGSKPIKASWRRRVGRVRNGVRRRVGNVIRRLD